MNPQTPSRALAFDKVKLIMIKTIANAKTPEQLIAALDEIIEVCAQVKGTGEEDG